MDNTKKQQGVTRRGFIRTVGICGVAATTLGITGPAGAQAPAGGQAAAMPKRKLGKTGAEVSILCLGGMFDTVNNQLLLRQALNWGVTCWDTAEAYGNGLSEEGIGLTSFKTQAGGQVKADSETEFKLVQKFLERGFTDKQAKLKAVWENPQIASICSQMPNLAYLSANVAAARDLKALAQSDFEILDRFAYETRSGYCAGCGRICQAAVGGKVPVNDVMRCLMYYRDYGDRELARSVFAGLPEAARSRLTEVDYSKAEKACPQGLAIAALMAEASDLLA